MAISFCKHSFPCQPPHGSLAHPGNCVHCDTTWDAVQDGLRQQEQALVLGSSRDGTCPDCGQPHRLYRFQPQDKPWTPIGHEEPVTFLCMDDWNAATAEDAVNFSALLDAI